MERNNKSPIIQSSPNSVPYYYQEPTRTHSRNVAYSSMPEIGYSGSNNAPNYSPDDIVTRPSTIISGHRKFNTVYKVSPSSHYEQEANEIVAKMEQNEDLMANTPKSEQLRKEALRDLPQCLTMKRCIKLKLTNSLSNRSKRKQIGIWKYMKYRIGSNLSKFKNSFKNFNYFELWHNTLKDIEGHFGSGYASYFKFLRWLFVMNLCLSLLSFTLITIPQIIYDSANNHTKANPESFQFKNIILGDGYFYDTILYYGHYTNHSVNLIPNLFYNMPAAYFSVIAMLFIISFIVLAVSVAQNYRRSFIETEGGLQNVYANKIFCGWDFGIATEKAAELKSSAIYHEVKELLSEALQDKSIQHSFKYKCRKYSLQIFVNVLIGLVLIGTGWICWLLLDKLSNDKNLSVLTAIVVNLFMMIFPTVFYHISKYEDYTSPRLAMYITLIRTYLLGCVIIGATLVYWLNKAESTDCWENRLGAEIYRLIVFDFIFCVVLATLIEVLYAIVCKIFGKKSKSEFNISKHTLQIIYNQALLWVGIFYSPILAAVVTLKLFILWYINEGCVRNFCEPPRRSWRAAQAQTWFMMLIFISVVLIIAVHGYVLNSIVSSNCGPFQDYKHIYEIVTVNITNLEQDSNVWKILILITKPGTVALLMIAVMILVYYIKEQAHAQKEKVKMLREMMIWLGKDKKYLVNCYNKIIQNGRASFVTSHASASFNNTHPQSMAGDYNNYRFENDGPDFMSEGDFNARFKKYC